MLILPILNFAQLSPGDIAFTGYNSDGDDQFSFIATTTVASTDTIYFTDRGYSDSISSPGWNNTYEGILQYIPPATGLCVGDMVVIQKNSVSSYTTSQSGGKTIRYNGTFGLPADGDQIFAFQSSDPENGPISFIAGIHMNNKNTVDTLNWDNITSDNEEYSESDLPNTLTNRINAIWVTEDEGERENAKYNNTITQGSKEEIALAANNYLNWETTDTAAYILGYPETSTTIADGNWNSTSTWGILNIPGKITDVTINHTVSITNDCAADSIVVASNASLEINASQELICSDTLTILSDDSNSGSLIVNGSIDGTVKYKRYLSENKWHLVSSPVTGQEINSLLTNPNNSIPQNGSAYGMMDYNTSSDTWNDYFISSQSGNMESGKGYALRRSSDGTVAFVGNASNSNVPINVSTDSSRWNLIGNPYPCAINANTSADLSNNFLTVNIDNLDTNYVALYLWDEQDGYSGQNNYVIINNIDGIDQDYIQAGQGFFVKVREETTSVSFTTSMRTHQTGTEFKSGELPWAKIKLNVKSAEKQNNTIFYLNENMSLGLDVGYDAGMLKSNPDFSIYSKLIGGNNIDYAIQCLPYPGSETISIPLGLDITDATDLSFSAEISGLPEGISVTLTDKSSGTSTPMNESGAVYNTVNNENNTGRFSLNISKNNLSHVSNVEDRLKIYPEYHNNAVTISGNLKSVAVITVYDLSGRMVARCKPGKSAPYKLKFENRQTGVYVIHIQNGNQIVREKFMWIVK